MRSNAFQKDLDEWLVANINTMNQAYWDHDSRTLFKTADALLQKSCAAVVNIKDTNSLVLESVEEEIQCWHQYSVELFKSNWSRPPQHTTKAEQNPPTPEDANKDIQALKKHRASGVGDVTLEALKAAAQDPEVFKALHKAVCNIWNTGKWPPSMTKSVYIALHKKTKRGLCGNYRTLALISYAIRSFSMCVNADWKESSVSK